jgi:mRNA interferase MazF
MRPALALARAGGEDWILCQITSNPYGDRRAVKLDESSFASGSLRLTSYARPGKLFTASKALIAQQVGTLKPRTLEQVRQAVVALLAGSTSP